MTEHTCDDSCDPIECLIGVTVTFLNRGEHRYCTNCYYPADDGELPATCPGCFFPVSQVRIER